MKTPAWLGPIAFMCATSILSADFDLTDTPAPVAARRPKDVSVHGDRRIDDFFWLREKENPEVRSYLEAENAYVDAVLAPGAKLRAALYEEMRGRIKEDDTSAGIPYLGYVYYTRTEKAKQYAIYCRRPDAPGAAEEILLDLNELGRGKPYISVGHYRVSDDGARLAYSIDWTGYRQYEVFVMDLATKQLVPQHIGKVAGLEWGAGHNVLYYVTENAAKRSDQLHRWTLETGRAELLYEDKDELFNLQIGASRDRKYLFCADHAKTSTEVRLLRADDHAGQFRVLLAREPDHEYDADFREGRLYLRTNKGAKNFRIVTAPLDRPGEWTELIPPNPAVKIENFELFAGHMVVGVRENGLPHLEVFDFSTKQSQRLALPDEVYEISEEQNWEYQAAEFRYRYQSLARPASVFASNFVTGERRLVKETEVLGGFKSSDYRTERVWATARDGTRIPLSIVYRKDLDRTKPQPLLLYGYGSYGLSMPATFSSNRVSLLDRGLIYVIAHIRGGGELGEEWRDAGRMEKKMITFTDFVDCGQWLVDHGWTTPQQMVTSGGSAGGLLLGAAINLRPDLFKAALLYVPFVDVLNTMLDASLPLTTEEYIEWGNPNIKEQYFWMRAYSPYDNLKKAAYPNLLVNVSFFDSQVPYWEGAKFLAKARTLDTAGSALLLHTNFGAGHGGAAGRYDALHDVSRDYVFFLTSLGLTK